MRVLARLALGLGLLAATAGVQAQPSRSTFAYDANGNLTSKIEAGVVWTYRYDGRDLLIEVLRDGAPVERYEYDYRGRRVRKTGPDGVVRYLWDGDRLIAELNEAGETVARYTRSGDRLVELKHRLDGSGAYLLDALGSPVSVGRDDGTLASRYRYDAWGAVEEQVGESANPFGFTGYLFDGITGLYYAKARYYDPDLGRFISADPFEGTAQEPRSLHPYLYAYANPTAYVDADGRCVGELQRSGPCQAIARYLEYQIAGDPLAIAERDVDVHQKAMAGRRQFREQMGREPLPGEVVWSEGPRQITAGFEEIDTSGRIEADHAEWLVASAGVGGRIAHGAARASGASSGAALTAAVRQAADEAAGELVGVSPGDVRDLGRLATARWEHPLARTPGPPGTVTIVEGSGLSVGLVPTAARPPADVVVDTASPSRPATTAVGSEPPAGAGAYREVGGHHVHAKAGFRGHATYDPRRGFSISQDFMESRNWNHRDMTRRQYGLFRELAESGRENTLVEHSRIAVEALKAGGATDAEARGLVALSVWSLRGIGVRAPTRVPWFNQEP